MRAVIWLVLLFTVAVVTATTLGTNDGLVTFYWGGWRLDLSMNLFLVLMLGSCVLLVTLIRAVNSLVGLPRRARQWRVSRRDRTAQAALREGRADLIAFGRPFIANPDLVGRLRAGAPLNALDKDTLYGGGAKGYTEYPALARQAA